MMNEVERTSHKSNHVPTDAESVPEGCPICRRIREVRFDTLALLQYNVATGDENDLNIIGVFAVCGKHLKTFDRVASSVVSAKLLRYLISKRLTDDGANGGLNILRAYERKCPVCEQLETVEREEVRRMAHTPFGHMTGGFVCVDHLKQILTAASPGNGPEMLEAFVRSLQLLYDRLRPVDSESYRRLSGQAREALVRAVEVFAGEKD